MQWRVCRSLLTLRDEIDERWPSRSKASDGTIGNAAHAKQGAASDHNPWVKDTQGVGVVTAMDITHDPGHGVDCAKLAEQFRTMGRDGDSRVKYVIWNRRIASVVGNWVWRAYSGSNPHDKHVHLSVSSDPRFYDSLSSWFPQPPSPKREADVFIGTYADGRIFVVGVEGKRLVTRAVADELKAFGIPERKVSSSLLNVFPTLPAPEL